MDVNRSVCEMMCPHGDSRKDNTPLLGNDRPRNRTATPLGASLPTDIPSAFRFPFEGWGWVPCKAHFEGRAESRCLRSQHQTVYHSVSQHIKKEPASNVALMWGSGWCIGESVWGSSLFFSGPRPLQKALAASKKNTETITISLTMTLSCFLLGQL